MYSELGLRRVAPDSFHSINVWRKLTWLDEFPATNAWVFPFSSLYQIDEQCKYDATKKMNAPTPVAATARFLGLRVRIPPAAWMSVVSVVCCQIDVSASDWSLVQRSPNECGVYNKVWSRNLNNVEVLAHYGPWGEKRKKKIWTECWLSRQSVYPLRFHRKAHTVP
jgi:hypothetical protein